MPGSLMLSALVCVATLVPAGAAGAAGAIGGTDESVGTEQPAGVRAPGVGQVVAWGSNFYRQAVVPDGLRGVTAISAGWRHNLALRANGTVLQWEGAYVDEPRPHDDGHDDDMPDPPAGLRNVTAVAAGYGHSMALRADGTVVRWGAVGSERNPVPAGLSGVTAIAAGTNLDMALRSDGTVVTWGDVIYHSPAGLGGVAAIAAGERHGLALRSDGTVVAWGQNFDGQTNVPARVRGAVAIAGGSGHSLAALADGTVVAWGDNHYGQATVPAGLDSVVAVSAGGEHSLALRSDGSVVAWGSDRARRMVVPAGLPPVAAIASGSSHALGLLTEPWLTCGSAARTLADATTLAGAAGTPPWGGDGGDGGPAGEAQMTYPKGLARAEDGTIYVADSGNARVRRIDPVTGLMTAVVGNRWGSGWFSGDNGPAHQADVDAPSALAISARGDLLIADTGNDRIRSIDHNTGIITTVAGTGRRGYGGDGGPATAAALFVPQGLAVGPDGSVYVADTGNHRVRRIAPNGLMSTVAGTGTRGRGRDDIPATASALHFPRGVAVAADGTLFIADSLNHRVRRVDTSGRVTTVAGTGVRGCHGDGGPATAAGLYYPNGLALGPDGALFVADSSNGRVRRLSRDGIISTFAGTGSERNGGWLIEPQALLAVPGGALLVTGSNQVHRLSVSVR